MATAGTRPAPIPLTVLTGFLGAGKTTLLNRLLADPGLADTVVIINELGEVGLDHLLVETADDDLVLLSAGCLCCTVRGDLVSTLEDLLRRRDNGRITPFGRVLVETTGLADPAPVVGAVLYHPYLSMRFALAGIVAVVDAVTGGASLDRHEEARRQAAMAERLVLTKTDLADPAASDALEARLRRLNPGADIRRLRPGEAVGADILPATPFGTEGRAAEVVAWLRAEEVGAAADEVRHDERIRSLVLRSERPVRRAALDMFLEILRASYGPRLLRLKGLVEVAENPGRPVVIHGVQHVLHVPAMLDAWPDPDTRSRIVLILDDVPAEAVERLWGAFTGQAAVDAPDADALADNPLAPATMARR